MHLFVFMPERGKITNWNFKDYAASINEDRIYELAPTASKYCHALDGTRHKFAKICQAIDNDMQDAIMFEVDNDADAAALLAEPPTALTKKHGRGYYSYCAAQLRYVYKDIDYDKLSTQAIFELLSKSDDDAAEKLERKRKVKRMSSLKRAMSNFVAQFSNYSDLTTKEFKETVLQLDQDFEANHDVIKNEMTEARKEADRNKVSIRAKLSKFAVYNSKSKK